MSNSSFDSGQHCDTVLNRLRRKRLGNPENQVEPSVTSLTVDTVGSSFSKTNQTNSSHQGAESGETSEHNLQRVGTSKASGSGISRSIDQQSVQKKRRPETHHLLDYFPAHNSNRRLTRSQLSSKSNTQSETVGDEGESSDLVNPVVKIKLASNRKTKGKRKEGVKTSKNSAATGVVDSSQAGQGDNSPFQAFFESEPGELNRALQNEFSSNQDSASPLTPSTSKLTSVKSSVPLSGSTDQTLTDTFTLSQGRMHRTQAATFLTSFVPRMQQLLTNSHSHSSSSKVGAIMDGVRSTNEIRQAEAAGELAEMLILGNEESLPNLPIRDIINALILLLQKEHNFELMLSAARCISNMLEALPRALPVALETVPYLLERLKRIECIDVAEQALMALEVMSRRNGKSIMLAGGIAATISHVDFFSEPSQRLAFQVAANCAAFVTASDFIHIRDSLPDLTQRFHIEDKRCLESVCTLFYRLVDNVRGHPERLREIAGQSHELLRNVQKVLEQRACPIGASTFQSLIRMLRCMTTKCSDLAVVLIYMDFARTIRFLLVGDESNQTTGIEVLDRPHQHLQEIVFLAGELLPPLPSTGIFSVDLIMLNLNNNAAVDIGNVQWMWRDDAGHWQSYCNFDSRLIEIAFSSADNDLILHISSNEYRLDFQRMVQISHNTGSERAITRRLTQSSAAKVKSIAQEEDHRQQLLQSDPERIEQVAHMLFPILVEIDGSSSGPALRYESFRLMLRMIHASKQKILRDLSGELSLSGHIANGLASPNHKNLCVVASSLQIVHVLLEKLPEVYVPLFKRDGVVYEIEKLSQMKSELLTLPPVRSSPSVITTARESASDTSARVNALKSRLVAEEAKASSSRSRSSTHNLNAALVPGTSIDGDPRVIVAPSGGRHRRKNSPDSVTLSPVIKSSRRKNSSTGFFHSIRLPSLRSSNATPIISYDGTSITDAIIASNVPDPLSNPLSNPLTNPLSNFLSSMNQSSAGVAPVPSSFVRTMFSSSVASLSRNRTVPYGVGMAAPSYPSLIMSSSSGMSDANQGSLEFSPFSSSLDLNVQQREKVRMWIRKEAEHLLEKYFPTTGVDSMRQMAIKRMCEIAELLQGNDDIGIDPIVELKELIVKHDVSAFELKHTGIILAFSIYLTSSSLEKQPTRQIRLKRFAKVFLSLTPDNLRPSGESNEWDVFEGLVCKLLQSVSQLEQFQVKLNDVGSLPNTAGGTLRGSQALRYFQTHQIRCNLRRHPNCRELKEWRRGGGSIKVDPFTSIGTIERYLLDRGVTSSRSEDSSGDDDGSDDDEMPTDNNYTTIPSNPIRIEILLNDEKIPEHMTIFQAIREYGMNGMDEHFAASNLLSNTYTLFYRAAMNVVTTESEQAGATKSPSTQQRFREKKPKIDDSLWLHGEVPKWENPLDAYLVEKLPTEIHDRCAQSLLLLRVFYGMNRYWWTLFTDENVPPTSFAQLLPNTAFHSTKLNAKLNRQLSDFLSVALQQFPSWITDLTKAVPFLFTFSSRRTYLYCTSFGRDRALSHLVNQNDNGNSENDGARIVQRLEKKRLVLKRDDLLKQTEHFMSHIGNNRAVLELHFEGEPGTGYGPTLEFYSMISREIQRSSLKLWRGEATLIAEEMTAVEYTVSTNGLYPAVQPLHGIVSKQREARLKKFELFGRILAQVLLDTRMLDIPLNPVFFKWLCGEDRSFSLADLEIFDKELYASLRTLFSMESDTFEGLELSFTLPGDDSIELLKGGRSRNLDSKNVVKYVKLVVHWLLVEGVRREMEAVKRGFETLINIRDLSIFAPEEMEELFCGCSEITSQKTWSESVLRAAIRPDHGYAHDSIQILWLIRMLTSFDREKQRKFLQFATGSPKLPVGGFKSLNPPLTVVRKSGKCNDGEHELPSAMTCYNYLKIPPYSTYEIFIDRFSIALRYIYSFYLT